jgi:hypothetical protein
MHIKINQQRGAGPSGAMFRQPMHYYYYYYYYYYYCSLAAPLRIGVQGAGGQAACPSGP